MHSRTAEDIPTDDAGAKPQKKTHGLINLHNSSGRRNLKLDINNFINSKLANEPGSARTGSVANSGTAYCTNSESDTYSPYHNSGEDDYITVDRSTISGSADANCQTIGPSYTASGDPGRSMKIIRSTAASNSSGSESQMTLTKYPPAFHVGAQRGGGVKWILLNCTFVPGLFAELVPSNSKSKARTSGLGPASASDRLFWPKVRPWRSAHPEETFEIYAVRRVEDLALMSHTQIDARNFLANTNFGAPRYSSTLLSGDSDTVHKLDSIAKNATFHLPNTLQIGIYRTGPDLDFAGWGNELWLELYWPSRRNGR